MDYFVMGIFQLIRLILLLCVIPFLIFLFKLLLKVNKYLDRQLKMDCKKCQYRNGLND